MKKLQNIYPELMFAFASWDDWPHFDHLFGFRREYEFILLNARTPHMMKDPIYKDDMFNMAGVMSFLDLFRAG